MKPLLYIFFAIICLILSTPDTGQARIMIDDPGIPDTIYTDSTFAVLGDPVILPVYFVNDEPLVAIEVTLTHNYWQMVIDSFSFEAGRVDYIDIKGISILDDTITIYAFQSTETEIPPGRGLLGHVYLSYPPETLPRLVEFDTTTVIINLVQRGNYFSVQEIQSFTPQFIRGYRNLQYTCCTGPSGNIDDSEDEIIDIADLTFLIIYLFVNSEATPSCLATANVDGSYDGVVDIGDLTRLIAYLFIDDEANPLVECP